MLASLGVAEPLCQTEINNVYVVLLLADADEEVVRLDITMEEVPRMDKLDSLEHLIGQHKHCFKGEFAFAVVEKVLKTWSEQVDDHDIVVALNTEPVYVRNTH